MDRKKKVSSNTQIKSQPDGGPQFCSEYWNSLPVGSEPTNSTQLTSSSLSLTHQTWVALVHLKSFILADKAS